MSIPVDQTQTHSHTPSSPTLETQGMSYFMFYFLLLKQIPQIALLLHFIKTRACNNTSVPSRHIISGKLIYQKVIFIVELHVSENLQQYPLNIFTFPYCR